MNDVCRLMYKCRMCGQVFADGTAPRQEALQAVCNLITNNGFPAIDRTTTHGHDSGALGIADFIGIEQEETS